VNITIKNVLKTNAILVIKVAKFYFFNVMCTFFKILTFTPNTNQSLHYLKRALTKLIPAVWRCELKFWKCVLIYTGVCF